MMSAADTIKTIRKTLYLEVREFARILEITPSAVYYYEAGARLPKLSVIKKIREFAKKNGMEYSIEDFEE